MNVENATRLEELWDEWTRANELIDSRAGYEGYLLYDDSDTLDTMRGVLRDVCRACVEEVYYDIDWCVSNCVGYEGHEDMVGATCALCGEDFWTMKNGTLVLFEPEYAMKRWG